MPLAGLEKQLKKGLAPIYVVLGQDTLVVEKAEAAIRAASLAPGMEVFNLAVFRGDDEKVDEALSIVRTMPMMASRRVVVVRGVENLKSQRLEEFLAYAASPVDSCVFVLTGEKWPPARGARPCD